MSRATPHRTGRGLLANSAALIATTHITALLGYVFWIVCARGFSASTIGLASTVISAMTLVAILSATGLEPFLTRVLPGATSEERSGLCSTALVLTAVLSGVAGVVGALLLPGRVHAGVGTGWLACLLGAGAVGTALLLVINAALLGVRRAELSLLGNVVGSLARPVTVAVLLGLGIVVSRDGATATHTILAVWVASLMISFGLSIRLLVRATPGLRFLCGWIWVTRLRREVAWDHVAMLAGRLPALGLPVLASAIFPLAEVGYASVALMISSAFFAVSSSVSNSLLANCADRPERIRTQTLRAVWLISALLIAPVAVTCLLASNVLGVFGADYANYGTLLVLLLVATLPDAVINVGVAILRVQRRLVAVAVVSVTGAAVTVGGALLLWILMPQLGITGAGWSTLASGVIIATTLVVMWPYLSRAGARTAGTAGDSPACVVGESPVVAAPVADVSLLAPVVAFASPADESPPESTDPSGRT
jgi:O-antigen/teichoic acid export membrane protein